MVGGHEGEVFKAPIAVSDALPRSVEFETREYLITLMNPRPRHQAFYLQGGRVRGRKFYFHRPVGIVSDTVKSRYNKLVRPVKKGSTFTFRISCGGLAEDDLGLLLYSLVLEEDMAHKIGMGKPLGFGSARIEIESVIGPTTFGAPKVELTGSNLAHWVTEKTENLRGSKEANLLGLRMLLRFDHADKTDYRYPGKKWFEKNPDVPPDKVP
jgi:hypothetical protein